MVNDVIATWENAAWKCLGEEDSKNFEEALKKLKDLDVEGV